MPTPSASHGAANSGTLEKRELAKAMKVLRIDVSDRDIDDLFEK